MIILSSKINYTWILLLSTLFLFSACGKEDRARFTLPVEATFFVQPGLNSFETHFVKVQSVPIFLNTGLANSGMTKEAVTSIISGKGQLIPISTNIEYRLFNDFSINAISILNGDKLDEMYYQDVIRFDHTGNLELLSSISELRDIMINGVVDIEIKFNLRQSTLVATEHKIVFELEVFD